MLTAKTLADITTPEINEFIYSLTKPLFDLERDKNNSLILPRPIPEALISHPHIFFNEVFKTKHFFSINPDRDYELILSPHSQKKVPMINPHRMPSNYLTLLLFEKTLFNYELIFKEIEIFFDEIFELCKIKQELSKISNKLVALLEACSVLSSHWLEFLPNFSTQTLKALNELLNKTPQKTLSLRVGHHLNEKFKALKPGDTDFLEKLRESFDQSRLFAVELHELTRRLYEAFDLLSPQAATFKKMNANIEIPEIVVPAHILLTKEKN